MGLVHPSPFSFLHSKDLALLALSFSSWEVLLILWSLEAELSLKKMGGGTAVQPMDIVS